ncbi:hypothetical protein EON65_05920 [archaeon]|nr:MAG: hypothetical protein EON65_05920 [archaeon]
MKIFDNAVCLDSGKLITLRIEFFYNDYLIFVCNFALAGCVYGGNVSAVLLPEERIATFKARRQYSKRAKNN